MNKYLDTFFLIYYFNKNLFTFFFYYIISKFYNEIDLNDKRFNFIVNLSSDLNDLNVNYLKIMQAICYEKNFLNNKEQEYLLKFTNNTPFKNFDINIELINYLKENNVEFNSECPINSGISALVYKGKYNNKNVAIKILKNNAELKLYHCLETIEFIFNIFEYFPLLHELNLLDLIKLNKKIMIDQVNFINEKENMMRFKNNTSNYDNIFIPEVHKLDIKDEFIRICYDNKFIIMDFIDGFNFQQLINLNNPELNARFGEEILRFSLISCLLINSIHCDLHPGNFILNLKEKSSSKILDFNEIIALNEKKELNENYLDNYVFILNLIDFGIAIFPDEKSQEIYYEYLKNIYIYEDSLKTANFVFNNLNENKNIEKKVFDKIINEFKILFDSYILKKKEVDLSFVYLMNKIFKKYNLKFINEIMKIQLSLLTSVIMTKNLIGDEGLLKSSEKIFKDLVKLNEIISFD